VNKIAFTRRAKQQAIEAVLWWKANRLAAPDLLEIELAQEIKRIVDWPLLGRRVLNDRLKNVRATTLKETDTMCTIANWRRAISRCCVSGTQVAVGQNCELPR
jgi:plasmid stabilization system protein ParE